MKEDKYLETATNLIKAADIAIELFKKYPPKIWDEKTVAEVINVYGIFKDKIENAGPKHENLKSLKYDYENIFTPFQEAAGEFENEFWNQIKEQKLPFKRENKLVRILNRKKINIDIEYDFVIDVIVPYQQEDLINGEEVSLLNAYVGDFESKKRKSY